MWWITHAHIPTSKDQPCYAHQVSIVLIWTFSACKLLEYSVILELHVSLLCICQNSVISVPKIWGFCSLPAVCCEKTRAWIYKLVRLTLTGIFHVKAGVWIYCILAHIHAECFQPDQDESGGGSYFKTWFTLSDDRFEDDLWSNQGDARCLELSV